MAQDVI